MLRRVTKCGSFICYTDGVFNDYKKAEEFVAEIYGLGIKYIGEESVTVGDGITRTENGISTYLDVKGGDYTYYEFQDSNHVIYKLVYFSDESIGNEHLIQMLQDGEMRDVKEWELLPQTSEQKNYMMYKLVPFTVQGLPTYS